MSQNQLYLPINSIILLRIGFFSLEITGKMYNETCCRVHGVPEDCMALCENPYGCCSTDQEYMGGKGSFQYSNSTTEKGWYSKYAIHRGVCHEYKSIIRDKCAIEIPQKQGIQKIDRLSLCIDYKG